MITAAKVWVYQQPTSVLTTQTALTDKQNSNQRYRHVPNISGEIVGSNH